MTLPVTQPLIARPARAAALASAFESFALTVLVAPAGYGKTSLLTLALAGSQIPAARYSAELWHAGDFVEPLVAEVRRLRPDFGRLTAALSQRRPADESEAHKWSRRLGATFASELGYVPEPIVVVLDDAHLLADDTVFAGFITGAMRALPESARIVLSGRGVPNVPLAEWLAQGRARIFEVDEIRFDDDDARSLAARLGRALDSGSLAELRSTYEGWAAGIALAFTAPESAVPSFDGSLPARSAYLLDANLDSLDAELTAFLEDTSIFETLDADVLERDAAYAHARRHLAGLERRGVMIETVRAGTVYRVHPLLRDALEARVRRREGPQAVEVLHARAAALLERAGQVRQALFHLEAAGDGDALARFIGVHAYDSFIAGQGERIARIAARLRREQVSAEPVFALVDGMIARQRGEPGAEAAFERGIAAATPIDPVGVACRLLVVEDRLARRQPVAPSQLEPLALAATVDTAVRLNLLVFEGWFAAIAGDFATARERSRRALATAGDDVVGRARYSSLEAYAATGLGEFDEADRTMASILRDLEPSEHVVLLANTLVWYGRFALLWGDAAAARDYGERGQSLASELDLSAELAGVDLALAEAYARTGDRARCERTCDDACRRAAAAWYGVDRERTPALAAYFRARAAFGSGDVAGAIAAAAPALAGVPSAQQAALAADAIVYRALERGSAPARADLESAAAMVRSANANDALDAAQIQTASEILELVARRYGIDVATAIAPSVAAPFGAFLAKRAARAAESERYADPVLRALAPATPVSPSAPAAPRGSALTGRENEILQLIAAGLTNREIAQRLTVSPRTVDTHVERILSKLEVTSRTRAVATALRIGLVVVS